MIRWMLALPILVLLLASLVIEPIAAAAQADTPAEASPPAAGTGDDEPVGVVGNTYTSPTWRFSVEWDEDRWEVEPMRFERGQYEAIGLQTRGIPAWFTAVGNAAVSADPLVCLDQAQAYVEGLDGVRDFQREIVRGFAPASLAATFRYVVELEDGEQRQVVKYTECRPLTEEVGLIIEFAAFSYAYEDMYPRFLEVLATLTVPGNAPPDPAAPGAGEGTPAATATPATDGARGEIRVGTSATVAIDVRLRAAPSPDAIAVADLARGAEVTVVAPSVEGDGFTWWPVTDPATGTIGYVRADVLNRAS